MRVRGKIISGCGRHVELHVPGYHDLPQAPADWPDVLCAGSLNIAVAREIITAIDAGGFMEPTFEIEQWQFGNNLLTPTEDMPRRGAGRVWRAILESGGHSIGCWVLRRYGSRMGKALEIVAGDHLRAHHQLHDGQAAVVRFV